MTTSPRLPGRRRRRQTIKRALSVEGIRLALGGLVGCPTGGWSETSQARSRLRDELPRPHERTHTLDQLIDAALVVDHAGRYQWREAAE